MNTAYLLLGANKGNVTQNLLYALESIKESVGEVAQKSGIYTTKAWGNTNQPDFLNRVLEVKTNLSPTDLLNQLLSIEHKCGRIRTEEKWQERTMDIDILFYHNEIINQPDLKIPHPFIQERRFVLVPMNEIAKEFIHPVLNKSISTLLDECEDELEVSLLPIKKCTTL